MSTRIQILSENVRFPDFCITDDVVRIGSAPSCDVRLADLEPRAITVQRKTAGYVVFNRGTRGVTIGRQTLAPGQAAPWSLGEDLRIGPHVALALADAAPPTLSLSKPARGTETHDNAPAKADGEAKRNRQIVSLCLCLVVGALLVLSGGPKNDVTAASASHDFESLVEELRHAEVQRSPRHLEIVKLRAVLQEARVADLRDELPEAATGYGKAQRLMLSIHHEQTPLSSRFEDQLARFLKARVERVNTR